MQKITGEMSISLQNLMLSETSKHEEPNCIQEPLSLKLNRFEELVGKKVSELTKEDILEIYHLKDLFLKNTSEGVQEQFSEIYQKWQKLKTQMAGVQVIVKLRRELTKLDVKSETTGQIIRKIQPFLPSSIDITEFQERVKNRATDPEVKKIWRDIKAALIASAYFNAKIFEKYMKKQNSCACISTNSSDIALMVYKKECALTPMVELHKHLLTSMVDQDQMYYSPDVLYAKRFSDLSQAHSIAANREYYFDKKSEMNFFESDEVLQTAIKYNPTRVLISLIRLVRFGNLEVTEKTMILNRIKALPDDLFQLPQWTKYKKLIGQQCTGAYGLGIIPSESYTKNEIRFGDIVGVVRSHGVMQFGVVDIDLGDSVRVLLGNDLAKVVKKINLTSFDDTLLDQVVQNPHYSLVGREVPIDMLGEKDAIRDVFVNEIVAVPRESGYSFGVVIEPIFHTASYELKVFLGFSPASTPGKVHSLIKILPEKSLIKLSKNALDILSKKDRRLVSLQLLEQDMENKSITKDKLIHTLQDVGPITLSDEFKHAFETPFPVVFAVMDIDMQQKGEFLKRNDSYMFIKNLQLGNHIQLAFTEAGKVEELKNLLQPLIKEYNLSLSVMSFNSAYFRFLKDSLS